MKIKFKTKITIFLYIFLIQSTLSAGIDRNLLFFFLAPKSNLSPISPPSETFMPFEKWQEGVRYDGEETLELNRLKLKVRRPNPDEIQKLDVLRKELKIPQGVVLRIITMENDYTALLNKISIGALETEFDDFDKEKFLFIREDILSAKERVLYQALELSFAYLRKQNISEVETEALEMFLSIKPRIEDFQIGSLRRKLKNRSLKDVILDQFLKLKQMIFNRTLDLKEAAYIIEANKFCKAFNLVYEKILQEASPQLLMDYFIESLLSKEEKTVINSDIDRIALNLRKKFSHLLPIGNIFYGTSKKPIDLIFLPTGDAIVIKGDSKSGKGSLMKALYDIGSGKKYLVGGEDTPLLFTAGGHLFAGTYNTAHNQISVMKDSSGNIIELGKIRARAFKDQEERDIQVKWKLKTGRVVAIIDLQSSFMNFNIPENSFLIQEDTISSIKSFQAKVGHQDNSSLIPIGRFVIKQKTLNYQKIYELAEILDKQISSMQSLPSINLNEKSNTLIDHQLWLMELWINDKKYGKLSDMDKKLLSTLNPDTELWNESYMSQRSRIKTRSKIKYMGKVKILPYGEIQFLFKNKNSGEEVWIYSWMVTELILNSNQDATQDEIIDNTRHFVTARLQDAEITTAYTQSRYRENQEDRHLNIYYEIDIIPNGYGRLLTVMDGHSGYEVAQMIEKLLPQVFEESMLITQGDVKGAIRLTYEKLNEYTFKEKSGSTLSILYIPDNAGMAYWGVLGDSPIIIKGRDGRIFTPPNHNLAKNKREQLRVLNAGVDIKEGYMSYKGSFLALSGALGDSHFSLAITREPYIGEIPIGFRSFAFIGSDGVYNIINSKEKDNIERIVHLIKTGHNANQIVKDVIERGAVDNVTAIVMGGHIRKYQKSAPGSLVVESYIKRWKNWKPSKEKHHPRDITNDKHLLLGAVIAGVIPAIVLDKVDDPIQDLLIEKAKEKGLAVTTAAEYSDDTDYIIGVKENVEKLKELLQLKFEGKIFIDESFRMKLGELQGFNTVDSTKFINLIYKCFSQREKSMANMGYTFAGLFNPYTYTTFRVLYSGWVKGNNLVALSDDEILVGPIELPWKNDDFQTITWDKLIDNQEKSLRGKNAFIRTISSIKLLGSSS